MQLPPSMLRRLRTAQRAQWGLWLAALLSVGGSLGLHPEPGDAEPQSGGAAAATAERSIRELIPVRHDCFACISHRPISIPSALALPSARARIATDALLATAGRPQRIESSNHEGRAPPVDL